MADCPCAPITVCIYAASMDLTWPDLPPCQGPAGSPWHMQDPHGWLHLAHITAAGALEYKFALSCVPLPAWHTAVIVDASTDCDHPRMAIDSATERIYLRWFRSTSPAIWEAVSDDDGATWTAPVLFMANAYQPDIGQAPDGDMVKSWFIYDAGTSGPGTIHAQYKCAADNTFGVAFTLKDDAGANIKCADGKYGNITGAWAPHAPWTMTLVIDGETDSSVWFSTDSAETWKRIT